MKFRPEHFQIALEEARQVVRAMPPTEVPHSLRSTRGSSSRRLTPVEARSLYRELDKDEGLRRATLESWGPPSPAEADPRSAVSVLFLERTENWESQARGFLAEAELEEARGEIRELRRDHSQAQAEIKTLRTQAEGVPRMVDQMVEERTKGLVRDLERAKERIVELERAARDTGKESERLNLELEAAFDELTEVDRRYDDLRDRYRSKKVSSTTDDGAGPGGVGFSRDPLETARILDQMVSFWEKGTDSPLPTAAAEVPWQMPPGIDPRSGGAVGWLYHDAPRARLVVDGWNVAYQWEYQQGKSGPPDHRTVEFVTNQLAKLARYSIGEHRVSFYLDSRQVNGIDPDWENRFQSGHLTGYYVENADDAITEEAKRRQGEAVVVITSDKELADRCRVHGAVALASEALTEWMTKSPV